MVIDSCREHIYYPDLGSLLSPYVDMVYVRDRDWTNKKPDMFLMTGEVKCIGYQIIIYGVAFRTFVEKFQFYAYRVSENILCNTPEAVQVIRDYQGPHYDIDCWNNSKTFNNRSYQVSFLCQTRCISKYRVRDGILDCFPSEEVSTNNNSCPQIQRHRLQCSSSELTCLLTGELGNWATSCSNGRDEFDYKNGMILTRNIACMERTDSGCAYLRNYIRMSSYDNADDITIANNSILDDYSTTTIPFRSYCDSLFNTRSGIDETSEFCQKWICFNTEYQCLSGQCISPHWICDGKLTPLAIFVLTFYFSSCCCR